MSRGPSLDRRRGLGLVGVDRTGDIVEHDGERPEVEHLRIMGRCGEMWGDVGRPEVEHLHSLTSS